MSSNTITRESLMTLEAYAKYRKQNQPKVIAHRRLRTVPLGEHVSVQFEDETTIRYQIQEMLRIEKIFEEEGIQAEIDVYAPLVPDGTNWKATMMIEYPDVHERKRELARLIGIEDRMFVEVEGHRAHLCDRRRGPRAREPKRRPRRCTSCASSFRRTFARPCAPAPRSSSAATTPTTPRTC